MEDYDYNSPGLSYDMLHSEPNFQNSHQYPDQNNQPTNNSQAILNDLDFLLSKRRSHEENLPNQSRNNPRENFLPNPSSSLPHYSSSLYSTSAPVPPAYNPSKDELNRIKSEYNQTKRLLEEERLLNQKLNNILLTKNLQEDINNLKFLISENYSYNTDDSFHLLTLVTSLLPKMSHYSSGSILSQIKNFPLSSSLNNSNAYPPGYSTSKENEATPLLLSCLVRTGDNWICLSSQSQAKEDIIFNSKSLDKFLLYCMKNKDESSLSSSSNDAIFDSSNQFLLSNLIKNNEGDYISSTIPEPITSISPITYIEDLNKILPSIIVNYILCGELPELTPQRVIYDGDSKLWMNSQHSSYPLPLTPTSSLNTDAILVRCDIENETRCVFVLTHVPPTALSSTVSNLSSKSIEESNELIQNFSNQKESFHTLKEFCLEMKTDDSKQLENINQKVTSSNFSTYFPKEYSNNTVWKFEIFDHLSQLIVNTIIKNYDNKKLLTRNYKEEIERNISKKFYSKFSDKNNFFNDNNDSKESILDQCCDIIKENIKNLILKYQQDLMFRNDDDEKDEELIGPFDVNVNVVLSSKALLTSETSDENSLTYFPIINNKNKILLIKNSSNIHTKNFENFSDVFNDSFLDSIHTNLPQVKEFSKIFSLSSLHSTASIKKNTNNFIGSASAIQNNFQELSVDNFICITVPLTFLSSDDSTPQNITEVSDENNTINQLDNDENLLSCLVITIKNTKKLSKVFKKIFSLSNSSNYIENFLKNSNFSYHSSYFSSLSQELVHLVISSLLNFKIHKYFNYLIKKQKNLLKYSDRLYQSNQFMDMENLVFYDKFRNLLFNSTDSATTTSSTDTGKEEIETDSVKTMMSLSETLNSDWSSLFHLDASLLFEDFDDEDIHEIEEEKDNDDDFFDSILNINTTNYASSSSNNSFLDQLNSNKSLRSNLLNIKNIDQKNAQNNISRLNLKLKNQLKKLMKNIEFINFNGEKINFFDLKTSKLSIIVKLLIIKLMKTMNFSLASAVSGDIFSCLKDSLEWLPAIKFNTTDKLLSSTNSVGLSCEVFSQELQKEILKLLLKPEEELETNLNILVGGKDFRSSSLLNYFLDHQLEQDREISSFISKDNSFKSIDIKGNYSIIVTAFFTNYEAHSNIETSVTDAKVSSYNLNSKKTLVISISGRSFQPSYATNYTSYFNRSYNNLYNYYERIAIEHSQSLLCNNILKSHEYSSFHYNLSQNFQNFIRNLSDFELFNNKLQLGLFQKNESKEQQIESLIKHFQSDSISLLVSQDNASEISNFSVGFYRSKIFEYIESFFVSNMNTYNTTKTKENEISDSLISLYSIKGIEFYLKDYVTKFDWKLDSITWNWYKVDMKSNSSDDYFENLSIIEANESFHYQVLVKVYYNPLGKNSSAKKSLNVLSNLLSNNDWKQHLIQFFLSTQWIFLQGDANESLIKLKEIGSDLGLKSLHNMLLLNKPIDSNLETETKSSLPPHFHQYLHDPTLLEELQNLSIAKDFLIFPIIDENNHQYQEVINDYDTKSSILNSKLSDEIYEQFEQDVITEFKSSKLQHLLNVNNESIALNLTAKLNHHLNYLINLYSNDIQENLLEIYEELKISNSNSSLIVSNNLLSSLTQAYVSTLTHPLLSQAYGLNSFTEELGLNYNQNQSNKKMKNYLSLKSYFYLPKYNFKIKNDAWITRFLIIPKHFTKIITPLKIQELQVVLDDLLNPSRILLSSHSWFSSIYDIERMMLTMSNSSLDITSKNPIILANSENLVSSSLHQYGTILMKYYMDALERCWSKFLLSSSSYLLNSLPSKDDSLIIKSYQRLFFNQNQFENLIGPDIIYLPYYAKLLKLKFSDSSSIFSGLNLNSSHVELKYNSFQFNEYNHPYVQKYSQEEEKKNSYNQFESKLYYLEMTTQEWTTFLSENQEWYNKLNEEIQGINYDNFLSSTSKSLMRPDIKVVQIFITSNIYNREVIIGSIFLYLHNISSVSQSSLFSLLSSEIKDSFEYRKSQNQVISKQQKTPSLKEFLLKPTIFSNKNLEVSNDILKEAEIDLSLSIQLMIRLTDTFHGLISPLLPRSINDLSLSTEKDVLVGVLETIDSLLNFHYKDTLLSLDSSDPIESAEFKEFINDIINKFNKNDAFTSILKELQNKLGNSESSSIQSSAQSIVSNHLNQLARLHGKIKYLMNSNKNSSNNLAKLNSSNSNLSHQLRVITASLSKIVSFLSGDNDHTLNGILLNSFIKINDEDSNWNDNDLEKVSGLMMQIFVLIMSMKKSIMMLTNTGMANDFLLYAQSLASHITRTYSHGKNEEYLDHQDYMTQLLKLNEDSNVYNEINNKAFLARKLKETFTLFDKNLLNFDENLMITSTNSNGCRVDYKVVICEITTENNSNKFDMDNDKILKDITSTIEIEEDALDFTLIDDDLDTLEFTGKIDSEIKSLELIFEEILHQSLLEDEGYYSFYKENFNSNSNSAADEVVFITDGILLPDQLISSVKSNKPFVIDFQSNLTSYSQSDEFISLNIKDILKENNRNSKNFNSKSLLQNILVSLPLSPYSSNISTNQTNPPSSVTYLPISLASPLPSLPSVVDAINSKITELTKKFKSLIKKNDLVEIKRIIKNLKRLFFMKKKYFRNIYAKFESQVLNNSTISSKRQIYGSNPESPKKSKQLGIVIQCLVFDLPETSLTSTNTMKDSTIENTYKFLSNNNSINYLTSISKNILIAFREQLLNQNANSENNTGSLFNTLLSSSTAPLWESLPNLLPFSIPDEFSNSFIDWSSASYCDNIAKAASLLLRGASLCLPITNLDDNKFIIENIASHLPNENKELYYRPNILNKIGELIDGMISSTSNSNSFGSSPSPDSKGPWIDHIALETSLLLHPNKPISSLYSPTYLLTLIVPIEDILMHQENYGVNCSISSNKSDNEKSKQRQALLLLVEVMRIPSLQDHHQLSFLAHIINHMMLFNNQKIHQSQLENYIHTLEFNLNNLESEYHHHQQQQHLLLQCNRVLHSLNPQFYHYHHESLTHSISQLIKRQGETVANIQSWLKGSSKRIENEFSNEDKNDLEVLFNLDGFSANFMHIPQEKLIEINSLLPDDSIQNEENKNKDDAWYEEMFSKSKSHSHFFLPTSLASNYLPPKLINYLQKIIETPSNSEYQPTTSEILGALSLKSYNAIVDDVFETFTVCIPVSREIIEEDGFFINGDEDSNYATTSDSDLSKRIKKVLEDDKTLTKKIEANDIEETCCSNWILVISFPKIASFQRLVNLLSADLLSTSPNSKEIHALTLNDSNNEIGIITPLFTCEMLGSIVFTLRQWVKWARKAVFSNIVSNENKVRKAWVKSLTAISDSSLSFNGFLKRIWEANESFHEINILQDNRVYDFSYIISLLESYIQTQVSNVVGEYLPLESIKLHWMEANNSGASPVMNWWMSSLVPTHNSTNNPKFTEISGFEPHESSLLHYTLTQTYNSTIPSSLSQDDIVSVLSSTYKIYLPKLKDSEQIQKIYISEALGESSSSIPFIVEIQLNTTKFDSSLASRLSLCTAPFNQNVNDQYDFSREKNFFLATICPLIDSLRYSLQHTLTLFSLVEQHRQYDSTKQQQLLYAQDREKILSETIQLLTCEGSKPVTVLQNFLLLLGSLPGIVSAHIYCKDTQLDKFIFDNSRNYGLSKSGVHTPINPPAAFSTVPLDANGSQPSALDDVNKPGLSLTLDMLSPTPSSQTPAVFSPLARKEIFSPLLSNTSRKVFNVSPLPPLHIIQTEIENNQATPNAPSVSTFSPQKSSSHFKFSTISNAQDQIQGEENQLPGVLELNFSCHEISGKITVHFSQDIILTSLATLSHAPLFSNTQKLGSPFSPTHTVNTTNINGVSLSVTNTLDRGLVGGNSPQQFLISALLQIQHQTELLLVTLIRALARRLFELQRGMKNKLLMNQKKAELDLTTQQLAEQVGKVQSLTITQTMTEQELRDVANESERLRFIALAEQKQLKEMLKEKKEIVAQLRQNLVDQRRESEKNEALLTKQLKELRDQFKNSDIAHDREKKLLDKYQRSEQTLIAAKTQLQKQLADTEKAKSDLENSVKSLKSQLQQAHVREATGTHGSESKIKSLQQRISHLEDELQTSRSTNAFLKKQLDAQTKQISRMQEDK